MPKRKLPERVIAFRLENVYEKKGFPSYFNPKEPLNLYGQIKSSAKPSEWRDYKLYWLRLLCNDATKVQKEISDWNKIHQQRGCGLLQPMDLTDNLKVNKAWFLEDYSKGELIPKTHLETEITGLWYHPEKKALEIKIDNTVEVKGLHNNQSNISKTTLDKK
jgi:hypothetical protein